VWDYSGEFKREDSARAWLNCFVLDLVQCVQLVACCHAIKRVFFAGTFCSTPLVRSIITTQFARRNLSMLALRWVDRTLFVHGRVTIIFVVSVCLSVCLCRVFLSRL